MTNKPALSFFDPEHVERPVPPQPWGALLAAALAATLALTAAWEVYWRGKGFEAHDYKNSPTLWAEQRRLATDDKSVIIGSSRIFFGFDLDTWERATGDRPIQLALEGTSPRIFLTDLANDESVRGLVLVGVTVPLFFGQEGGLYGDVLDRYKDETLSQRLDHWLATRIVEPRFAFIDDQTRPRLQFVYWPWPVREGMGPRFYPRKLESLGIDRGAELWGRVASDERYRQEAIAQWATGLAERAPKPGPDGAPPPPFPQERIDAVIAEVKANVEKIRARGGDVAFFRFPYEGGYAAAEDMGFPRERFWDRLVAETDSVGVSFHDHPELQGYYLPEWSHLEAREAERYTAALAPIFLAEMEKKKRERAAR